MLTVIACFFALQSSVSGRYFSAKPDNAQSVDLNKPVAVLYIVVSSFTDKYSMIRILFAALLFSLSTLSNAEDFHGFNPPTFDGLILPSAILQAIAASPLNCALSNNDEPAVTGFANRQRDIGYANKVETNIRRNANQ